MGSGQVAQTWNLVLKQECDLILVYMQTFRHSRENLKSAFYVKSSSFKILDQNQKCQHWQSQTNHAYVANLAQAFLLAATNVHLLGLTADHCSLHQPQVGCSLSPSTAGVDSVHQFPMSSVLFRCFKDFILAFDSCGIYFGVTCKVKV